MVRSERTRWALIPAGTLVFSLFFFLGFAAQAQQPQPAQAQERIEKLRLVGLDQIIGMQVRNPAGEDLGRIRDVVIDAAENEVRYAVLAFGGWLGLGQDHFAYPLEVLQLPPARDVVILDVSREQLEQAPGFDARQIPDWNTYLAQVDRFWGPAAGAGHTAAAARAGTAPGHVPPGVRHPAAESAVEPRRAAPGAVTPAEPVPGVAPSPVPRPGIGAARPVPPRMPDEVRRMEAITADDLIGRGIRDRQGQHIGQVRDIIANFDTGEIEFAVVALDRGWLERDRLATLPMDAFRRDPRFMREVMLDMSRQEIAQAPSFHADRWPQFEEQDFRTAWERFIQTIRPGGDTHS